MINLLEDKESTEIAHLNISIKDEEKRSLVETIDLKNWFVNLKLYELSIFFC